MESNLQGTFLLNNTPLAQFSEMKAPVCQYSVQNSFYKLSPPGLGPQLAAGTPHGITDILSRPVATPNNSLLSSYPHVAGFGGLGSQGVYYGPQVGNFSKTGNEYVTRTRNCWADTGQDWRGGRQCNNSEYGAPPDQGGGGMGRGRHGGARTCCPPLLSYHHTAQLRHLDLYLSLVQDWVLPSILPSFVWMGCLAPHPQHLLAAISAALLGDLGVSGSEEDHIAHTLSV